jgi:F-type H+-transporting ATPase subunit a
VILAAGNFNPVEHLYDRYSTWVTLWGVKGKGFIDGWNDAMPDFMHMTQHSLMMLITMGLLLMMFGYVTYVRNSKTPKGLRNFLEPIVLYLRNEVIRPNFQNPHFHHGEGDDHHELPEHWLADKFAPFLMCMFFFIVIVNLLGLIPGSTTASSQITFTASMAALTFVTYMIGSVVMAIKVEGKGVGGGIQAWFRDLVPVHFSTKPMDFAVWLLLLGIELASLIIKPVALTIRLFANMTAGHCLILSLLFLNQLVPTAEWRIATGIPTVLMSVAIYFLEIFVGVLQAYIFTFLSAMFIGGYLVPEH